MLSASRRFLNFNKFASNFIGSRVGPLTWSTCFHHGTLAPVRPSHLYGPSPSRILTSLQRSFAALSSTARLQSVSINDSENPNEEHIDKNDFVKATSLEMDISLQEPLNFKRIYNTDSRKKFRNYSYSDYSTAAVLKRDFEKLIQNDDASITPVTAYQFIRNCGNKMSAESPESRILLVNEIWQKLKEKGVTLETTHYNTLLSVYIQNRHKFSPLEFLSEMQEWKIQPDKSTYMLIVQAYCQEGDLSGALRVIEFMSKQDIPVTEPVYTALVTGYSRNDDMAGAYQVLDTMRDNGIKPEVDTYTALIAGFASKGDLESVDKVLEEMENNNVKTNSLVFMNMLDSLCRYGHSALIPEGLARIKQKTPLEMELRYFLQRLISRGDYESAAVFSKNSHLWLPSDLLRQDDYSPYNLFVYRLLKVNKPVEERVKAMKVLESHEVTKSPLEDVLEQCFVRRNTDDAVHVLRMLKDADRKIKPHYAYPIVVQLAARKDTDAILDLLSFLSDGNVKIDSNIFSFALPAFKEGDGNRLEELMKFAKDKGIRVPQDAQNENLNAVLEGNDLESFFEIVSSTNVGVLGTKDNADKLTDFLIRTFNAEETCKAIVELDQKNVYRLGGMLFKIFESFNRSNDTKSGKDAFNLFQNLTKQEAKKRLTPYAYTALLSTLFRNGMKEEFFEVVNMMKEEGIEPNEAQYFIMLKMSSFIGNSAAAQFCFDKLKTFHEPTEAQYNGLLIAYGKDKGKGESADESTNQYINNVISLYEEMKLKGMKLHDLAVSQVIIAYLTRGKIEEAEEVRRLFGSGATWRQFAVYNEYLRAFAKRKDSEASEKLFKEMKDLNSVEFPSVFSYNQLIGVHKQLGNIERINEIIEEMNNNGIVANKITYSEVAKAHIRRGEPDKALDVLEAIADVNLLPSFNLFNSLIDEFVEKSFVQSCERVIAVMRRQKIDDWEDQRLRHILLFLYLKDNNFAAATDIINKEDFKLTQRNVMRSLRKNSKNVDLVLKIKHFLKDNSLNYFVMDLPLLNAYIADKNADGALELFEEKKNSDTTMSASFISKLSNFLESSGREIPFDKALLNTKKEIRIPDHEEIVAESSSNLIEQLKSDVETKTEV